MMERTNRWTTRWILLPASLSLAGITSLAGSDQPADHLVEFMISDQFDREYTLESFSRSVVIVIQGDKDGSAFTGKWGSALGSALRETVGEGSFEFVAVADLRGVPFFMKGWVRKQFSPNKEEWVLLDWDGVFTEACGIEKGKCNLTVFDQDRRLVEQQAVTEPEPEAVKELAARIGKLIPME